METQTENTNVVTENQEESGSLIKCPLCSYTIRETDIKCYNCGYDLREKKKSIEFSKNKRQKIKLFKRIAITAICILILFLLLILGKSIIKKPLSISRAKEYISQQDYINAITVLSPYKYDNDVILLYEKIENSLSMEEHFLVDLADGLNARWESTNKITPFLDKPSLYDIGECINREMEHIEKYKYITFADKDFNNYAHMYIDGISLQRSLQIKYNDNIFKYDFEDWINALNKFGNDWGNAYAKRITAIMFFYNNYNININKKYKNIMKKIDEDYHTGVYTDNNAKTSSANKYAY